MGMEDVFGALPLGAVTLGTGPGVISSQPDKFSYETNGYTANSNNRDVGFRQRQQPGGVSFLFAFLKNGEVQENETSIDRGSLEPFFTLSSTQVNQAQPFIVSVHL